VIQTATLDWVQLFQTLGIPILFLGGALWVMLRLQHWLMVNVVKPWTDRHLLFVDRLERSTTEYTIVLAAVLRTQEQHAKVLTEISRTLTEITSTLTKIVTSLAEVVATLKAIQHSALENHQ